jgi:hypothetical protein
VYIPKPLFLYVQGKQVNNFIEALFSLFDYAENIIIRGLYPLLMQIFWKRFLQFICCESEIGLFVPILLILGYTVMSYDTYDKQSWAYETHFQIAYTKPNQSVLFIFNVPQF